MEAAELLQLCGEFIACSSTCDPASFTGDELKELTLAVEGVRQAVEWLSGEVLEQFQQSGAWREEGSFSGVNWVAARTGGDPRELSIRMRTMCRLRHLPHAAGPASLGRLSPTHLRELADCTRKPADFVQRDSAMLVALAEELPARDFRIATANWRSAVDDEIGDPTPDERDLAQAEPSRIQLAETLHGRWYLSGDLAPDDGSLLAGILQAGFERHTRAARTGDPSYQGFDAAAIRGAAFADFLTQAVRREPSERSVPDRYRTVVVITPRWLRHMRTGMTCRDLGCVFPGCDRPPAWCEIHHCHEYHKGGSTSVHNGVLLCRHHHVFLHKRQWYIEFDETGTPQVHQTNGDIYTIPQIK